VHLDQVAPHVGRQRPPADPARHVRRLVHPAEEPPYRGVPRGIPGQYRERVEIGHHGQLGRLNTAAEQLARPRRLEVSDHGAVQLHATRGVPSQVGGGHDLADEPAGDRHALVVDVLHPGCLDRGADGVEGSGGGVGGAVRVQCGTCHRVFLSRSDGVWSDGGG
jgi:hypothetical protein